MMSTASTDERALATLRSTFGYESFRPLQQDIVQAIMGGRDVFVLMPTGAGKSLCYQLPALLSDGLTVVVSPLIALMKDQVDAMQAGGGCHLHQQFPDPGRSRPPPGRGGPGRSEARLCRPRATNDARVPPATHRDRCDPFHRG